MQQLEAFTQSKVFGEPEANEDCLMIMPGLGYAVIDGVSGNGARFGGIKSGQFAARIVKRAIEQFCLAQGQRNQADLQFRGGAHLVEYLSKAIRDGYAVHGVLEAAAADKALRGACTVTAVMLIGNQLEVVAVGDSGLRINGTETLQMLMPLDDVTAILRRESWRFFENKGRPPSECGRLAAQYTGYGTRNQPVESEAGIPEIVEVIEQSALTACLQRLPDVPESEILVLIQHGIARGQSRYHNNSELVLGYGCIDGFAVPGDFIETRSYPLQEIETLELFSDGYFAHGEAFGVASWEAMFREVEREDPYKIGRFMSTKGTTNTHWTDDRSYIGVRLKQACLS